MFIKLTNSTEIHKGDPIWINCKNSVAIYEWAKMPGGSLTTFIYGSTGIVWEVEETAGQVLKLISIYDDRMK